MGLFNRKKADNNKASKEVKTTSKTGAIPAPPSGVERAAAAAAPSSAPQTTVRVVGDSKHAATIQKNEQGQEVRRSTVSKSSPVELEQRGTGTKQSNTHSARNTNTANSTNSSNNNSNKNSQRTPPLPPTAVAQSPPTVNVGNNSPAAAGDELSSSLATIEVTRELVKGFIADIWNRGDIELIKKICHPSLRFNGHVGMDRVGHEGFARMVTTVREALTDYHCEIHSMVVESNKAFCRLKFTGRHTGVLLGYPPTGRPVAWVGASEFTCKNGKILKVWELGDVKSLEAQLRSSE